MKLEEHGKDDLVPDNGSKKSGQERTEAEVDMEKQMEERQDESKSKGKPVAKRQYVVSNTGCLLCMLLIVGDG